MLCRADACVPELNLDAKRVQQARALQIRKATRLQIIITRDPRCSVGALALPDLGLHFSLT